MDYFVNTDDELQIDCDDESGSEEESEEDEDIPNDLDKFLVSDEYLSEEEGQQIKQRKRPRLDKLVPRAIDFGSDSTEASLEEILTAFIFLPIQPPLPIYQEIK